MTLTDFLLARIAEDEALWTLARDAKARLVAEHALSDAYVPTAFAGRLLAECEAKRRVVHLCRSGDWTGPDFPAGLADAKDDLAMDVLTNLALPYADHPDYREEWKP